jgi:dTDP-4-amino-4,6-dideoxygalactose transaminase
MEAICSLAREFNLMVIEDCAQAYVGNDYHGHPNADVSMFSFGPIKTNTAVGGAVFSIRNPSLLQLMNQAHERWPVNSRWSFAKRTAKYAGVRLISTWLIAGIIARVARWFGTNHDLLATKMARGFPGPQFFEKIRQQPSTPLLRLLAKKLQTFSPAYIENRRRRGIEATERLRASVDVLGSQMLFPTYWVFPILVENRDPLVEQLWRRGFDATTRSSLVPINRILDDSGSFIDESPETAAELPISHFLLRNLVFLPFDTSIPANQIQEMIDRILSQFPSRPARPASTDRFEPVGAICERLP